MNKFKIGQLVKNPLGQKAIVTSIYNSRIIEVSYLFSQKRGYGYYSAFKPTR
jgi:hypothetical protein